jgi:hypothetical protein
MMLGGVQVLTAMPIKIKFLSNFTPCSLVSGCQSARCHIPDGVKVDAYKIIAAYMKHTR